MWRMTVRMALSSSCASSASSCVQTAQSRRRGALRGSKIGSRGRRGGAACSALPNECNWGDTNTQAVLEGRGSRRQVLTSVGAALTGIIASNGAFETASPMGGAAMAADFAVVTDAKKGYVFAYPFGWQEVQVDGQEAVYKDVIESLESLSLTVTPTEKKSIDDFGTPVEAANLFLDKVWLGAILFLHSFLPTPAVGPFVQQLPDLLCAALRDTMIVCLMAYGHNCVQFPCNSKTCVSTMPGLDIAGNDELV